MEKCMCIKPGVLPSGQAIGCHVCDQCRAIAQRDWVGRCIAESKVTWRTLCCTLTYGSDAAYVSAQIDHHNAQVLTYSDVQKYLKNLRLYTPGRVRFMCTGEKGTKKGRAHWHLIAFFESAVPPNLRLEERYVHHAGIGRALWPHGWSYWQEATPETIRYACKYITKDIGADEQREHRFSTRPPLGFEWFRRLALEYVQNGLSPQNLEYSFGDVLDKNTGKPWVYRMSVASGYYFLLSFMDMWIAKHGNHNWPYSRLVEAFREERFRRDRRGSKMADWSEEDFVRRGEVVAREKAKGWVRGLGTQDPQSGTLYPPIKNDGQNAYRKVRG